jgi:hypothetical protein
MGLKITVNCVHIMYVYIHNMHKDIGSIAILKRLEKKNIFLLQDIGGGCQGPVCNLL